MTCTVVWRPSAEQRLAQLWTSDEDRQAVTNAANSIDRLLRADPTAIGESRIQDTRILVVPPLAEYYEVHTLDRLVAIWAVWKRDVP